MSQYITGTVTTTAGSNVVTGSGTSWLTEAAAGNIILIGDVPTPYTVGSVDSNTQLTLTANFPTALTSEDYVLVRDFTPSLSLPLANQGDLLFANIMSRALGLIDAAIAAGVSPVYPLRLNFPNAEVPTANNLFRTQQVAHPQGCTESTNVFLLEIPHVKNIDPDASAYTRIVVSDAPRSDATGTRVYIDLPYTDGQATASVSLTIPTGEALYAWVETATGNHEGIDLIIWIRSN